MIAIHPVIRAVFSANPSARARPPGGRARRSGAALLLSLFVLASLPVHAAVTFRSAASGSSESSIVYAGVGNYANAGSGNVTPDYPAGWQPGDLLLCILETKDNVVSTMPAGWAVLSAANSGANHRATIFWKIAALGDNTTPAVTHAGGNSISARIIGFTGVNGTTPFDVANSFTVSGADLTTEAAAITTVTAGTMLVFTAHMADNHTTLGTPAGSTPWTQAFFSATASGSDSSIGAYYGWRSAAGAQPAVTATRTGAANAISHGAQIALRPATTSTLIVPKPTGTLTADVMIASVSVTPSTVTITPPVGWTLISTVTQNNATSSRLATYHRVAGVGEPATYTWSFSGASHSGAVGGIASFSGVDNSAPVDVQAGNATASATSHTAPSVTTTQADGMLVTVHEYTSSGTWTAPGTMTEAVDVASQTPNNAAGISMEMNWEARPTAGATGTRQANASTTADSGAVQSISLKPTPLVCYTDDFNRADGSPGTDWVVSNSGGSFGNPVIVNNRLRLTDASGNAATMATLQRLFPGSGNRIEVDFDHFAYGGSGADGIAVTLSDSSVTPAPGGYGGSLGYAQRTGINGFAGGWLGIGIDEYGNFSNPTEGRQGGPGFRVDSIAIRGSGSGTTGYAYHAGTNTLAPQVDNNGAAVPPHHYRIIVDHSNGVNALVSVERDVGAGYVTLVAPYDAKAQAGQAVVPNGWLLSYTGSTGGATNVHEIDTLRVCATSQTPLSGIHHFDIIVGPSASTCASQSVTFVAKDISNNVLTGYTGSVIITTSTAHGDWSAPAVNGTADDGVATYTFVAANNGSVTFQFSNTHADDLTFNITDVTVPSTSTTSAVTSFRDSAFVVTPDPIQIAGRPQNTRVELYTRSGGGCGIDTNYTGARNLDVWLTLDPNHPAGATLPTIGALTPPTSAPASNPGSNNLALTFTGGTATFNLNTTDVGRYVLNVRDDTRTYATAVDLGGASGSITTRPWLHVAVPGNPADNTAGGSVFTSAGTEFTTTARGVLWQSADDNNVAGGDGIPDSGANLADNAVAPRFAWDTVLQRVAPFTPATSLDAPPGSGTAGTLDRSSTPGAGTILQASFVGASATTTDWRYSEVGSFTMRGMATNYLNSGVNVYTDNGVVGRFNPAYFDVTRIHGCLNLVTPANSFTYSGQPFTVTVAARNALGNATQNYDGALGFSKQVTISNAGVATNFSNNSIPAAGVGSFAGGTRIQPNVTYIFPAKETAPAILTLRAVDNDTPSVSSAGHIEETAEIRSGRINIMNAYGSELADLPVTMRVERYTADGWAANADDTCSVITLSALSNFQNNLSAGETCVQDTGNPGVSGQGCAVAGPVPERFTSTPSSGSYNLHLRAPGVGNEGSVDVGTDLSTKTWLRYDWDDNGTLDNPAGRASFGLYRGSPKHIYQRQRY